MNKVEWSFFYFAKTTTPVVDLMCSLTRALLHSLVYILGEYFTETSFTIIIIIRVFSSLSTWNANNFCGGFWLPSEKKSSMANYRR
ncbi:hypothetical protein K2173_025145 [Erythroxylum novogranatense]|uniref:Uncharacterized protein n=1 Tax=Erythroxylum novogranatense TaxID=1862640 RepID=A0AAV8SWR5_9ROSI|nr:hypothetical protein K2173_025145 [Erythroxylum novogranatense]